MTFPPLVRDQIFPRLVPMLLTLTCLVAAACGPSVGDDLPAGGGVAKITASGLLHDVEALSADAMAGRGTGTPGEEMAANYIQHRFEEIGLSPVGGSFLQEVRLVGTRSVDGASTVAISSDNGSLDLIEGVNATTWSSSQVEAVRLEGAPLLFVGYGVQAPEYDWDDFKGADVAGKVLLFLNDDPPVSEGGLELFGGEARTYYGRWTYKFEQAMNLGAAGAIMIHTTPSASYPFSVIGNSGTSEHFALDLPGAGYQLDLLGWIDEHVSGQIAAAMGTDLDGLFAMGREREFVPVDTGYTVDASIVTAIRRIATYNVMGMLEGRDPELREQVMVFSAHYDHVGTNANVAGDDKIFNGAWDNAAGTAAIIALAEAFAAPESNPRPARSLLFLACAAEENGSLGSAWFVASPPFERARLVADINVDMPQIFGVTADIAAIGADTNTLGDALSEVAASTAVGEGRTLVVTGDPNPRAGNFYRSDQVNFAKAGIPALFINPGGDYVEPLTFDPRVYRDEHYHQARDEVNESWNLAGLERDMRVLFATALRVANDPQMPRWVSGNEFEAEWRTLHGVEP